jgi:hypothetical protein
LLVDSVIEQPQTALMQRFCSLGDNCELGMAQRRFGAEPADLLRWAAIDNNALLAMLRDGAERIGDPTQLSVSVTNNHYWIKHAGYGLGWHSLTRVGSIAQADTLRRETTRMPRLAETWRADLSEASRIFVLKRSSCPIRWEDVQAVRDAMDEYGDAPLLLVTQAQANEEPGTVDWAAPNILHGRIRRFAISDDVVRNTDAAAWWALCTGAADLLAARDG